MELTSRSMSAASTAGSAASRSSGVPATTRRPGGLAHGVLVAERGDEQHKASGLGQIGDARRERALEALGQRQAAGHRWLVLGLACNRRQFQERKGLPAASRSTRLRAVRGRPGAAASSSAAAVVSSRPASLCSGNPASVNAEG